MILSKSKKKKKITVQVKRLNMTITPSLWNKIFKEWTQHVKGMKNH